MLAPIVLLVLSLLRENELNDEALTTLSVFYFCFFSFLLAGPPLSPDNCLHSSFVCYSSKAAQKTIP